MLINQNDIRVLSVKDYILNPKPSGYKSYHPIVTVPIFLSDRIVDAKVEIQIRTVAMDFWASLEHKLRYKKNIPESEAEYLAKELVECASISASLDQRMEAIRDRMEAAQEKMS